MEYSKYYHSLTIEEKVKYEEKLKFACVKVDPYGLKSAEICSDVKQYPPISYPDLCNYLVSSPNPEYNYQTMKCHKSLQAHNFFTSGWVKEVGVAESSPGEAVIVRGRVLHSQSVGATATHSWIIARHDGVIVTAHCDCKAGQGGTCSHVAAVLFYIEAAVRIRGQKTVTQEKAYWLLPRALGKLQYEKVSNTDFTSSARKKRQFDDSLGSTSQEASGKKQRSYSDIEPSEEEMYELMKSFSESGARSVMLSVKAPFNRSFIPTAVRLENYLSAPLTKLKNDKDVGSDIEPLTKSVQQVKVAITEEQASLVESCNSSTV